MHLQGTVNVTVDHCLFDGAGGNGVALLDFNRGAHIAANEMRHLGENGVILMGSTQWVDGRNGEQPRFNEISGNLIHHLGLYTKQSCAVFNAVACQNTITQNIFFHGPRALLNVNDGFGGSTLIKQNLFFASVLETSDHGPFNCWDRQPYLTNVRTGQPSLVLAWNTLESNLFMPVGEPYPIDSDDGCNQLNVSSNVLLGNGLIKTHFGGHSKRFEKNAIMFPFNPGWAHGGCVAHVGDPTNVFSQNKVVGIRSLYNCGNNTETCHQLGTPATQRNLSCACPTGLTPHPSASGNATSCATISGNTYYFQFDSGGSANASSAVCPEVSRIEASSTYVNGIPNTSVLIGLAKEALGM